MPRLYVNSMSNFVIQGGIVSFTLQDQALRTEGGQPRQAPPEDVVDLVMREQDFAQLVKFLNQHLAAYQQQTGRQLGAETPPAGAEGGRGGAAGGTRPAAPAGGGGFKIRPKGS